MKPTDQLFDIAIRSALGGAFGDHGDEALNHVDPRTVWRNEMHVPAKFWLWHACGSCRGMRCGNRQCFLKTVSAFSCMTQWLSCTTMCCDALKSKAGSWAITSAWTARLSRSERVSKGLCARMAASASSKAALSRGRAARTRRMNRALTWMQGCIATAKRPANCASWVTRWATTATVWIASVVVM